MRILAAQSACSKVDRGCNMLPSCDDGMQLSSGMLSCMGWTTGAVVTEGEGLSLGRHFKYVSHSCCWNERLQETAVVACRVRKCSSQAGPKLAPAASCSAAYPCNTVDAQLCT